MNWPEPTRPLPDSCSVHACSGATGPGRVLVCGTAGHRSRSLVKPAPVPRSFLMLSFGSRPEGQ